MQVRHPAAWLLTGNGSEEGEPSPRIALLRAIDPQRQEAVQRCSFKDCLPSDVAHLCFLKASSWLTPMVFDRGFVPPLPEAAYADRGVFFWRYPREGP